MKICVICKEEKESSSFHKARANKDGHMGRCKECSAEYNKEWQSRNPEKAKEIWKKSEKKNRQKYSERKKAKTYGLSLDDYRDLVEKHDGLCAICGEAPDRGLNVDHCHDTGAVRGLLCSKCNLGLGHFGDDPALIEKALKYLTPP
jgi:hypothetical protein